MKYIVLLLLLSGCASSGNDVRECLVSMDGKCLERDFGDTSPMNFQKGMIPD